jgi:iduronate 2-sulfatase
MKRAIAIFTLLVAPLAVVHAAEAPSKQPNVLLILVDDLKPALGAYGDKTAVTPHMDRLAARGMRFDMAYCNIAVCAPSRYNLMTGSRATSLGIYGFGRGFRQVFPDAVTLPQHFMNHGYHAESLGKVYHIGHDSDADAASFSVPHFKDLVVEYLDPASKPDGILTREEGLFSNQGSKGPDGKLRPRGAAWESPDVPDDAYADGRVANEAVKRLRDHQQNPAKPFFMAVGIARPHLPFSVPKKYWDLYDPAKLPLPAVEQAPQDAPAGAQKRDGEIAAFFPVPEHSEGPFPEDLKRKLIHGYYASTSYADAQIGKIIAALDETGLAANTVVVLWGDHGYHLGELGIWTKHVNYELANRIPLLIAAPGITTPGSATNQLAETVDLFPTLAELCGLPAPAGPQPIDGTSLVPVLKNPAARVRDHAYHCYQRHKLGRAIRTETHRLVVWQNPGKPDSTAEIELYEYPEDRIERKNIAAEQPGIVAGLRAILNRHPEPRPRP